MPETKRTISICVDPTLLSKFDSLRSMSDISRSAALARLMKIAIGEGA